MTKDEALMLALEALEEAADAIDSWGSYASGYFQVKHDLEGDISKAKSAITAIKEALAQPEQEPVAWLITDEKINSLQVDSIQRLIDRARHAHMTDIKLRINGQDEWFQADWLKHLTRTTPPQREPLTDEEIESLYENTESVNWARSFARAIEAAHGIKGEA